MSKLKGQPTPDSECTCSVCGELTEAVAAFARDAQATIRYLEGQLVKSHKQLIITP